MSDTTRGKRPDRAVALRYQVDQDHAPRVVGSGVGPVAANIVATARRAGVPTLTDAPLAAALGALPLGSEIPPALYTAVAAVLAYVYRLDGRLPEAR